MTKTKNSSMNGPRRSYRSKMRPFTFNAITKQSTDEQLTAEIVNNIRPNNDCIQVQTTNIYSCCVHLSNCCLLHPGSLRVVKTPITLYQPKRTMATQNINGCTITINSNQTIEKREQCASMNVLIILFYVERAV